jgi:tRNA pseudouridine synthase 10
VTLKVIISLGLKTVLINVMVISDSKFVASGREDVDVRTLGRGRPFAVELPNPHKTFLKLEALAQLQREINEAGRGYIQVRDLQLIHK